MLNLYLNTTSSFNNLGYKASINAWVLNKGETDFKTFVAFPDTLQTGWAAFTPGVPPDWHWDEKPGKPGKQPTNDHKRGFSIEVENEANGKMTWSGAGYGQCAALQSLMEDISTSMRDYPGKIPVVEYTGSEVKKVGMGQTRIPKFKIIDWVDPAFPPWKIQTEANDTPF